MKINFRKYKLLKEVYFENIFHRKWKGSEEILQRKDSTLHNGALKSSWVYMKSSALDNGTVKSWDFQQREIL